MQDERSGLQAHVDEREQGQKNSITALQIKMQKLKCTVHILTLKVLHKHNHNHHRHRHHQYF